MFNNLFGKKKDEFDFSDVTFISQKAKSTALLKLAKTNKDFLFIAWFPDTSHFYKDYFSANDIDPERVMDAKQFSSFKVKERQLIFLEHFPLRNKEEELLKNLPLKKVIVYNSLDEALFSSFGSERIIELLKKMGMQEDEEIKHTLVSKSIVNAQQKIAEKIIFENSASSQREWIEKNVK